VPDRANAGDRHCRTALAEPRWPNRAGRTTLQDFKHLQDEHTCRVRAVFGGFYATCILMPESLTLADLQRDSDPLAHFSDAASAAGEYNSIIMIKMGVIFPLQYSSISVVI
jgi:hypothetical protein